MKRKPAVKLKKMGMIKSTKNCAVSVKIRNSPKETSFQHDIYVNDLKKFKNAVLRDSATGKSKTGNNYNQTSTSNEQEKYSEIKKQRKY